MTIVMLGIDLGKTVCSLAGLDGKGRVVLSKRMKREAVVPFVSSLPVCGVAMEACCGAHCLGRWLADSGYEVRLIAPQYVRPYVKSQKNDDRDAEAIAEAALRPTMRFVSLKTLAQLDLQTPHRVRGRLIERRTGLINQIRGILLERGIMVPKGKYHLARHLPEILSNEASGLSPRIQRLLEELKEEWRALDDRIADLDAEFLVVARQSDATKRLIEIPGIGALTATALVAAIGTGEAFELGPRPRGLAGPGAPPGDDRRPAEAARHLEAGQRLCQAPVHPRRPRCHALPRRQAHQDWPVAAGCARAPAPERGRGGAGQQAGPDRLGRAQGRRALHGVRGRQMRRSAARA